jgi:NDP-sugar pyrophosphorylase family protein
MKAMIFAAGLGSRLRPLTDHQPKALVEVGGIPLLEIAIRRLKYYGVKQIIVNVHHFADQIEQFLQKKDAFDINIIISDERGKLLDTGGGLKKAAWFFHDDKPFLLYNADILTDLDIEKFYQYHLAKKALATLAVQERSSNRQLLFGPDYSLKGWKNNTTGETKWCRPSTLIEAQDIRPLAFSGIHVISPEIFDHMPANDIFSMIDLYLLIGGEIAIQGYPHTGDLLLDVGKPESIGKAMAVIGQIPLL